MSRIEWVRTALAVEHAGSITAGARERNLSQPAASQQIAALERALGIKLFERHRSGIRPTDDGTRFLGQVAAPFDQIEWLLHGLDVGRVDVGELPVTIGCQPEWFERSLLPNYVLGIPLRASFGSDPELIEELQRGQIDLAVTRLHPAAAHIESHPFDDTHYVLVVAPSLAPQNAPTNRGELAEWIERTPWVGFSDELPKTRRFWSAITGSLHPTAVALVAPDLRLVAKAVEVGLGASLLPSDLCRQALAEGTLVDVYPVDDLMSEGPRVLSKRSDASPRAEVEHVASMILDTA